MKYKLNQYLLIVLTLTLFSGCSALTETDRPPQKSSLASTEENALVFGRIRWIDNGKKKYNTAVKLRLLRVEDMKKDDIKVNMDGRFFTYLPKGTYLIYHINWFDLLDGQHWLRPSTAFQIVDGDQNHYLGTLVLEKKKNRKNEIIVSVVDEENNEIIFLQNHYPDKDNRVRKELMIHDPGIPENNELVDQQKLLNIMRVLFFGIVPTLSP